MSVQAEVREIAGGLALSPNALVVLKRRYLKKDESGEVAEGAPDMFRRVAETIAQVDLLYDSQAEVAATTPLRPRHCATFIAAVWETHWKNFTAGNCARS